MPSGRRPKCPTRPPTPQAQAAAGKSAQSGWHRSSLSVTLTRKHGGLNRKSRIEVQPVISDYAPAEILHGRADQSYGIQVARLAGLPDSIIARSKEILANLEKAELNAEGETAFAGGDSAPTKVRRKHLIPDPNAAQMPLH